MRAVDTRFWSDVWVRKLNALDRYMFLYFLTNEHSSWCGVYEVDLTMIAFESGIDEHDLVKSILPRLAPKVLYVDGWVCIKNFEKYHSNKSEKTKEGIKNAWKAVPERIRIAIENLGNKIPKIPKEKPYKIINLSQRESVLIRDRFICQYCQKEITEDRDYQIDHVIPISRGGSSSYKNYVLACFKCNQAKLDKTAMEFIGRKIQGKPYHSEKAASDLVKDLVIRKRFEIMYPDRYEKYPISGVSPSSSSSSLSLASNVSIATSSVAGKELNKVMDLFKIVNPNHEALFRNKTQREALTELLKKWGQDKIERSIKAAAEANGNPYAPRITTPIQLRDKLGSLIAFYQTQKTMQKTAQNKKGFAI